MHCQRCKGDNHLYIFECSHCLCFDCLVSTTCGYSYNTTRQAIESADVSRASDKCCQIKHHPLTEDDSNYFIPIPVPENNQIECPFCLLPQYRRHVLGCHMRPTFCPYSGCETKLHAYHFCEKEDSYNDVIRVSCKQTFPPITIWPIMVEYAQDTEKASALSKSQLVIKESKHWWDLQPKDSKYTLAFKQHINLGECKAVKQCIICKSFVLPSDVESHFKIHDEIRHEIGETVAQLDTLARECQENTELGITRDRIKRARLSLAS